MPSRPPHPVRARPGSACRRGRAERGGGDWPRRGGVGSRKRGELRDEVTAGAAGLRGSFAADARHGAGPLPRLMGSSTREKRLEATAARHWQPLASGCATPFALGGWAIQLQRELVPARLALSASLTTGDGWGAGWRERRRKDTDKGGATSRQCAIVCQRGWAPRGRDGWGDGFA